MKWLMVITLSILSILFLEKGIELWSIINHVGGDGVGVSFMGMSISEKVLNESLPGYALGFTVSALIPILVAINIALRLKTKKKIESNNI
jgi:hypothetical protein